MIQTIRESLEKREEGFTLIELLVVVIIIGILAAIAIPVFLNQRQKAWDSAVKSDLKNAATAQETYLTDNDTYTTVAPDGTGTTDLELVGFNKGADIAFTTMEADAGNRYCMEAQHTSNPGEYFTLDSQNGEPVSGELCPALP